MSNIDERLSPYGALILRVGLGTMWIAHALLKWYVYTIPGLATWLGTQGLPPAFAWPLFIMELVGGVAIVLGFYGRYVTLLLLPILLVAAWIHFPNGWLHTSQGGGWGVSDLSRHRLIGIWADWRWGIRSKVQT